MASTREGIILLNEVFGDGSRKLLLLASTGGHLAQLVRMVDAQGVSADSVWVTFDSPQSRSLLEGRKVFWVDYIAPRDYVGVYRSYRQIQNSIDPRGFEGVLSTGAALAVSGFIWARKHRIPSTYIESVSRTDGPSLTGKIVQKTHLARTFTQHGTWANDSWKQVLSVMQHFTKYRGEFNSSERPLKVLVTLGTIRPYRFDSLVDRICSIVPSSAEITWQLGVTHRKDLPGEIHELIEAEEFLKLAIEADVVITHSGVGTILQLLDHGICPVVVPRHKSRNEHVDDHQLQIWQLLRDADIAVPVEVIDLTLDKMIEAASMRTGVRISA